jgi:hypothetical protein
MENNLDLYYIIIHKYNIIHIKFSPVGTEIIAVF